jgi:hypothetical protein
MKHGMGKYLWADQSSYNGNWSENKINGKVLLLLTITRALIHGLMEENMKAIGKIIACMGKENIHGKTEENMKVTM